MADTHAAGAYDTQPPPVSRRARVLLLAPTLAGGGTERVIATLANRLDRDRFEVIVGLGRRRGPLLADLQPHVPVVEVGSRKTLRAVLPLARCLHALRPHLILTALHFGWPAALARAVIGSPARLIVRESTIPSQAWQREARASRLRAAFLRWTKRNGYLAADAVVCQSDAMRADIAAHVPAAAGKLRLIRNPVDVARVRALAERPVPAFPPAPGRHLLAVGRHYWTKGYDLLLPAFRLAQQRLGDLHLTILGDGKPEETAKLRTLARTLGIASRVHFVGFVDNPFAYMARADALVLTSRFEGLPNVVIEALCLGTPVIATDSPGGTRELIEPGVNGWLCGLEPEAIAAAIEHGVPAAPSLDHAAIREAAQRAYDVPTVLRQYERLIDDMLASSSP